LSASQPESEVNKGYEYIIQKGDSLASITQGFAKAGMTVSLYELWAANPGLDHARLRVGMRILVPAKAH
jgi:hypothetical protein